jgi:hypothetical protein
LSLIEKGDSFVTVYCCRGELWVGCEGFERFEASLATLNEDDDLMGMVKRA